MSATVEKQIQLSDEWAQRLEQLAQASGVTESALIEEALDLLFGEREQSTTPPDQEREQPITPDETVFVVGTPVSPKRLARAGKGC